MEPIVTAKHAAALSASEWCTSTARTPFCSSSTRYCLSSSSGFSRSPENTRYEGTSPEGGTSAQAVGDMDLPGKARNGRLRFEGTGDNCRR